MNSVFKINNQTDKVVIDIEGVIGVAEAAQFEQPERKVATYSRFEQTIEQIEQIEAQEVVVNIRSTGGDVNDALMIYEALAALDAHITTRCYGYVASAATIIAQAADQGSREISANSLYLIHRCESVCEGNVETMSATRELLEKSDRRIAAIYAERSGTEEQKFLNLMNENGGKGRWLTPDETIEAGLADTIVAAEPIANDAAELIDRLGLPRPVTARSDSRWAVRLTERWRSIAKLLGLRHGGVLTEQGLDVIDRQLSSIDPTPSAASPVAVATVAPKEPADEPNTAAKDNFASARATQLLETDDPSIGYSLRSANSAAYQTDAQRLRENASR